jgi:hypothetical protein
MIGLILGLAIYCALVVVLAGVILPVNGFVDFLFYLVAGILWIFPARWLILRLNREI